MSGSASVSAQGTTFSRGDGADPEVFTAIGGLRSIGGPSGSATVIDTTDLSSVAKEKCMGLPDEGQITLEAKYNSADAEQVGLRTDRDAQSERNYRMAFADGSTATFAGFVLEWSVGAQVDDIVPLNVTIEITGAVTWA